MTFYCRKRNDATYLCALLPDFEESISYMKSNYKKIVKNFDIETKWEDELEGEISRFFKCE